MSSFGNTLILFNNNVIAMQNRLMCRSSTHLNQLNQIDNQICEAQCTNKNLGNKTLSIPNG